MSLNGGTINSAFLVIDTSGNVIPTYSGTNAQFSIGGVTWTID